MKINIIYIILMIIISDSCEKNVPITDSSLIWKKSFNSGSVYYSMIPIIYQDKIIYSAPDSANTAIKLVAFNKKNGSIMWKWSDTNIKGSFHLKNYYIYNNIATFLYGNFPYPFVQIDLNTGKTIGYINETNPNIYSSSARITGYKQYMFSSFLLNNNLGIYVINVLTGNKKIIFTDKTTAWINDMTPNLCVYTGTDSLHYLCFSSYSLPILNRYDSQDYYYYKICVETNKIIDSININNLHNNLYPYNSIQVNSVTFSDANFLYVNGGGSNYQLKQSDLSNLTQYNLPPYTHVNAFPRVVDNYYLIPSERDLFCFNINTPTRPNNFLWQAVNTTGGNYFYAQILNGVVYFASDGGSGLYAIDANTGQIYYNKTGYVGQIQGSVVAVDPETNYVYTADYANALCYKAAR